MAAVPTKQALKHLAVVMDGNGRWAQNRLLPRFMGHRKGVEVVKEAIRFCADYGIDYLSLFAFSTENWKRPQKEVQQLMALFKKVLLEEEKGLIKNDARLCVIGNRQELPADLVQLIEQVEISTATCKTMTLVIYANYGGRWEITQAVKRLLKNHMGNVQKEISEKTFAAALPSAGIPDPDLLIRTSGETRVSNFMLWQLAYTELLFLEKTWPECTYADFQQAAENFANRSRRFGEVD